MKVEFFEKRIVWAVISLALATPVLMAANGILSYYKAGETISQVGVSWLVLILIINGITTNRSTEAKAYGRIIAAVVALVIALMLGINDYRDRQKVDAAKKDLVEEFMKTSIEANAARISGRPQVTTAEKPEQTKSSMPDIQPTATGNQADRTVALLKAMKVRAKQFAEENSAVERKFDAIDTSTILEPQNLINNTNIEASRVKLNLFKDAIAARDSNLKNHIFLSEEIIRRTAQSPKEVNEVLAGMNSAMDVVTKNFAELTSIQLVSVRIMEDILNFAQRGIGRITVENGQPMFQTQRELNEYQRLFKVLNDNGVKEIAILKKIEAHSQKSKQTIADQWK